MADTVKQKEVETEYLAEDLPQVTSGIAPGEIVIGTLTGIDGQGRPLVDYPENPANTPLAALTTLGITHQQLGREVALLFANGDPQQPVIMGLIHSPLHELLGNFQFTVESKSEPDGDTATAKEQFGENVLVDGKRVVLEAADEIVLKCGEASITLTKAGKILIRGKYLLNRSTGVNRIMGGSVQVN